ncbi:MAG: hypothetical protein QOF58_5859 [Pseudonocardiales bacterium]|nr:hypothetical protein [Pseudonocardiales bacterium]
MIAHGPSVSLDAVAREAGVSKGGLQALPVGLIGEWFDHYDAIVENLLEPEDMPGR